jgi:hypothetical protein
MERYQCLFRVLLRLDDYITGIFGRLHHKVLINEYCNRTTTSRVKTRVGKKDERKQNRGKDAKPALLTTVIASRPDSGSRDGDDGAAFGREQGELDTAASPERCDAPVWEVSVSPLGCGPAQRNAKKACVVNTPVAFVGLVDVHDRDDGDDGDDGDDDDGDDEADVVDSRVLACKNAGRQTWTSPSADTAAPPHGLAAIDATVNVLVATLRRLLS